jgi:3-oxoacyl-[acyl-carrier protein] reductase
MITAALTAKTVLITGGGSGIGLAAAALFARSGATVAANVLPGDDAAIARIERLAADGLAVFAVPGDVAAPDKAKRMVGDAIARLGRLDVLINNAGSGKWMPVDQADDDVLEEIIEISIRAPFRCAREALRVMKPGACILNISSTYAVIGGMNGGAYSVAKAGLLGLTTTMAADYGAKGIRTNMVAPGVVRTDMTDAAWELDFFQRLNQEMTPMDRDCTVEDVAATCFFLASKEGSFINGQAIAVDGGWSTTKYLSNKALTYDWVPPKG